MKDKLNLILLAVIGVFAFVLFFGFILSNIDPDNKIEAYTLAISFVGIFATFGGAYLGALTSGKYSLKVVEKQMINERKDNLNKLVTSLGFYNISLFKIFNDMFKRIDANNVEIEKDFENNIPIDKIIDQYKGSSFIFYIDKKQTCDIEEYIKHIKSMSPQYYHFIRKDKENANYYLNKIIILAQLIEIFPKIIKYDDNKKTYIHIKDSEDYILKTFKALLEVNNEIIQIDNNELYKRIYE
ncbi:hypothetical protein [Mammaliicoccus lentus]|uniref:hypothetical protein n=1 Tax=Mammaliicoccus lentus TaxID=42858 RepID=UPI0007D964D3|nr:hypothetical protein [Mammaliicoccus lentus]OAO18535.1 hypothetical protein AXY34_12125 [Mammaliicoccus lentus]